MSKIAPLIYVVDDDASVREALSSLIRSAGLRVCDLCLGAGFFGSAADRCTELFGVGRAASRAKRARPAARACQSPVFKSRSFSSQATVTFRHRCEPSKPERWSS